MDYSLFDAIRAGFTKVVFIVREEILDVVREKFSPKAKGKIEIDFGSEEELQRIFEALTDGK